MNKDLERLLELVALEESCGLDDKEEKEAQSLKSKLESQLDNLPLMKFQIQSLREQVKELQDTIKTETDMSRNYQDWYNVLKQKLEKIEELSKQIDRLEGEHPINNITPTHINNELKSILESKE